ncbi:hypothetical protein STCU_07067 [Strigomonas culicis]|uniref:Transcription factor Iwr1 domain-containing protein n=1 Tax=Strigomonas culicis TaxID=28005 RepID=S9U7A0_9TRYP|nr:hypothetical protein STCU_07067 [Strigomonas culicis]|eukprot:EPY24664.1 hypothetical protein STCU_07067 [Strigomonas culicis]
MSEDGGAHPKLKVGKVYTNNGLLVDCAADVPRGDTLMYKLDRGSHTDAKMDDFDFANFSISEPKTQAQPKRPRCDSDLPVFVVESVPRSKVRKLSHTLPYFEPTSATVSFREFVDCYQNDYVDEDADGGSENYLYYDHRKDDEYDSNAEDFSGNDYPENADEGSSSLSSRRSMNHSECSDQPAHRRTQHYGMFYEDDYEEQPLSEGWSSDDD